MSWPTRAGWHIPTGASFCLTGWLQRVDRQLWCAQHAGHRSLLASGTLFLPFDPVCVW